MLRFSANRAWLVSSFLKIFLGSVPLVESSLSSSAIPNVHKTKQAENVIVTF